MAQNELATAQEKHREASQAQDMYKTAQVLHAKVLSDHAARMADETRAAQHAISLARASFEAEAESRLQGVHLESET